MHVIKLHFFIYLFYALMQNLSHEVYVLMHKINLYFTNNFFTHILKAIQTHQFSLENEM